MTTNQKRSFPWAMLLVPAGLVAVMTPAIVLAASGGGGGFDGVVQSIEYRYHAHATRIPFMGLISALAGVSTHGGVHNLHLAEFDDFKGPVDGEELNTIVAEHIGEGWQRIVRETSRNGGEQSLIYVHPEGDHLGMMVVDLDGKELNVIQISVNPDQLANEINEHKHHNHDKTPQGDGDKDDSKQE
jgi:hypothetical protein